MKNLIGIPFPLWPGIVTAILWFLALFCDQFGGAVDNFGASCAHIALPCAFVVVPFTIATAFFPGLYHGSSTWRRIAFWGAVLLGVSIIYPMFAFVVY